jgi:hypothetical protein
MARTPTRISGPALVSNSAATKYTVPASTTALVRSIHVSNPTSSAVDFTLSIGTDAAGTRLYDGYSIPADTAKTFWCYHAVATGEIIQAFAGTNNVITLTIDADLIT